jgi:acyl-CoA reductase-like NAD-dependent aldehyde dehydrogenase
MKELTHFIGGWHVPGESGRFGDVFNPATGEVQAKVPFASRDELDVAVKAAQRVFPEWSGLNPQRRARVMFNFKSLIEKNMEQLAQMLSSEHGKVIADSKGDIQRGLEVIQEPTRRRRSSSGITAPKVGSDCVIQIHLAGKKNHSGGRENTRLQTRHCFLPSRIQ